MKKIRVNVQTLKKFFDEYEHDGTPIQLDQCTVIQDMDVMVASHFRALEANSGVKTFLPYYDRLVKLYELLNQNKNP